MRQLIVAHDLGTSGDKASLHAADGRLLAAHTERYPADFGVGGFAEQDPDDWWAAFCAATRRLLAERGAEADEVACVVLSGQMQSLVLRGCIRPAPAPSHHLGQHARQRGARPAWRARR